MQADTVLINAEVITMNKQIPQAQAVTIKDGRIVEVASNQKIKPLIGKRTKIIDLKGKTVVPGFTDAHAHMITLGQPFRWLELRDVSSIKEILRKLQATVKQRKTGKWIQGRGWDQELLREKRYPTRWDLDKVSPDNPVILNRVCGHIGVANSRALEIAGINRESAASWGELADRDPETGEPTGVLREGANDTVWNMPKLDEKEQLEVCRKACLAAVKAGLTSVHWFAYKPDEIKALKKLRQKRQLPLRIYSVILWEYLNEYKGKSVNDDFLKLRCLKVLTDGSLGARTAALKMPYDDDPSTKGILTYSLEELKTMIRKADDAGFQISVHAIGDSAVDQTLRAFRDALGERVVRKHRHRIEHVSVLSSTLIKRLKASGLLICIQPHFLVTDFWVERRLGPQRARWTYAFKSLLRSGMLVAASSDAPVEPLSPLLGIWAAVARQSFPEERITVEEALRAYTLNAAYLSFEEEVKGSIEVGKFADFTVLSQNPLKVKPEKIKDIKVVMTIVDGKIVYSGTA